MNLRRTIQWLACVSSFLVLAHCSDNSAEPPIYTPPDSGKTTKDTGTDDDDDAQTDDDAPSGDDAPGDDDDGGSDEDVKLPSNPLTGNGCAGGDCQNPDCKPYKTAEPIGTQPETGFDLQPSFIPNDTVIVTFDDVTDG